MNNLLNVRSSRGLACLMLSGILSVGIVGCDFLGLDGPGGTVGALGFDDVAGSNCAEGSAPAEPTVERPLPVDVSTARVYLTLGLISEYSQGIHRLAEKLEALDIQSRVINKSELDAATSDIVSEYEQSGGAIDIFLIGHSYGSDDAIALAANLDDAGIPVRLLVVLDASFPPGITDNVDECVHFYVPTPAGDTLPFIFAGNPITVADGNAHTKLENILFTSETYGDLAGCASHFSLDVNNYVHDFIIDEIIGILGQ